MNDTPVVLVACPLPHQSPSRTLEATPICLHLPTHVPVCVASSCCPEGRRRLGNTLASDALPSPHTRYICTHQLLHPIMPFHTRVADCANTCYCVAQAATLHQLAPTTAQCVPPTHPSAPLTRRRCRSAFRAPPATASPCAREARWGGRDARTAGRSTTTRWVRGVVSCTVGGECECVGCYI